MWPAYRCVHRLHEWMTDISGIDCCVETCSVRSHHRSKCKCIVNIRRLKNGIVIILLLTVRVEQRWFPPIQNMTINMPNEYLEKKQIYIFWLLQQTKQLDEIILDSMIRLVCQYNLHNFDINRLINWLAFAALSLSNRLVWHLFWCDTNEFIHLSE